MKYSQPDFYHFGEDSLFLVNKFIEIESCYLAKKKQYFKILDLCCGCGVIGLEIIKKLDHFVLESVDLQLIFKKHYLKNMKNNHITKMRACFIHSSVMDLRLCEENKKYMFYDYIVSNPPYFDDKKGRPAQNENRNLCRFFKKDGHFEFIKTVDYCLRSGGSFWLLKTTKTKNESFNHLEVESKFKETHCFDQKGFELRRFVKLDKDRLQ